MTVNEAVNFLLDLQSRGHGAARLRSYSDYSNTFYPESELRLHLAKNNEGNFDESYGTWVECFNIE